MKKSMIALLTIGTLVVAAGCATIGGTIVGAGIGYIAGDAELGAKVGMTAGAVHDVFGRR